MKRDTFNIKKLLLIAIPSIGFLISPNQALAGSTLNTAPSTCTPLDCGGSAITGTYVYEQPFNQAIPFNVQLFAAPNECLRINVTTQTIDTELALVSPDNQFWVNDDFNGLRPRIVANATTKGWYTLQVTKFDGGGPGGQFALKYGRYPLTNPNCSNPTIPAASAQRVQTKPALEPQPPVLLISP